MNLPSEWSKDALNNARDTESLCLWGRSFKQLLAEAEGVITAGIRVELRDGSTVEYKFDRRSGKIDFFYIATFKGQV